MGESTSSAKVITTTGVDTNNGDTSRPKSMHARWSRCEVRQETRSLLCDSALPSSTSNVKISTRLSEDRSSSKFPKEDLEPGDEGCVGQLQLCLHGARDAAQNWAHQYTTFLLSLGFKVWHPSPCNFTHQTIRVMILPLFVDGCWSSILGGSVFSELCRTSKFDSRKLTGITNL